MVMCAANRKACSSDVSAAYCTFTLPTYQLWLACFIANAILTFVVIPFAIFYYEADSESCASTSADWNLPLVPCILPASIWKLFAAAYLLLPCQHSRY